MTQPPRQQFGPPQQHPYAPPGPAYAPPPTPPRARRTGLVIAGVVGGLVLALVAVAVIWRLVAPPAKVSARDYQDLELRATNTGLVLTAAESTAQRLSASIEAPLQQAGLTALERQTGELGKPMAGVEQNPAYAHDPSAKEKADAVVAATRVYAEVLGRYRSAYPAVQGVASHCGALRKEMASRIGGDAASWTAQAQPCRRALDQASSVAMQQSLVDGYRSWLDLSLEHKRHGDAYVNGDPAALQRSADAAKRAQQALTAAVKKNAAETGGALDDSASALKAALREVQEYATDKAR
ncbi:hypothetical protein [Mariniluteicoccus flavus]